MLYLIRHGETDWNREPGRCQGWTDVKLNDSGREQARELGAALRQRTVAVDLIVSSHLLRARETAEIIREELGGAVPLTLDPRLAETFRGRWETRTFADIIASEPDEWRAYREHPESFRFPDGESLAEQQRRVLDAVRDAALFEQTVAIVTHGGSIRLVRCFLEGLGIAAFHTVGVGNADIVEIAADDVASRIEKFLSD